MSADIVKVCVSSVGDRTVSYFCSTPVGHDVISLSCVTTTVVVSVVVYLTALNIFLTFVILSNKRVLLLADLLGIVIKVTLGIILFSVNTCKVSLKLEDSGN